jgi:hypothetical protein
MVTCACTRWAPAGEAERVLRNAKGTVVDPVTEVK